MFLREVRASDLYLYIQTPSIFFESYEDRHRPSDEYLNCVQSRVNESPITWSIERHGYWFHASPSGFDFPLQGWKIHVSATLENSISVLEKVAQVLVSEGAAFKFVLDRNLLSLFSSKRWGRGSSGKFITIYPRDIDGFTNLLELLYQELRTEMGPYILSDRRYKDCRVLYYRYGGIRQNTRLDFTGLKVPVLVSPEGNAVPDIRQPFYSLPPWVSDPFPAEEAEEFPDGTLKRGRYSVTQALAFSNSGGVYLALDNQTGVKVVLKEARPHTLMSDVHNPDNNAIALLNKERDILLLLSGSDVAPHVVDSFSDWENSYLVQEYIAWSDLRVIMMTQSPLLRVSPTIEESRSYYSVYKELCVSLLRTLHQLHLSGVVFGDMSANNVKIDPLTYSVRLIDFEGAYRPGIDPPINLFTFGYRRETQTGKNAPEISDDLYGLAAIMLYMLFPLTHLSQLREDLYDGVLKIILNDLGWSRTPIYSVMRGLITGTISAPAAIELLEAPSVIEQPRYEAEIDDRSIEAMRTEMMAFIANQETADNTMQLFPSDPFAFKTNPLSLGFGASGVLYALQKCGSALSATALEWLRKTVDQANWQTYAPGLLNGTAGISWCLAEIGLEERAVALMRITNSHPLRAHHYSLFYGVAGVGMANLYHYKRNGSEEFLNAAMDCSRVLLSTAKEHDAGVYWSHDDRIELGYGYGASGVALFLLRMSQITGDPELRAVGARALKFDLSHASGLELGVKSVPRTPNDNTLEQYLEEGSAGIARVAIRYGMWEVLDDLLMDLNRKYSRFAGLLYGLGGFVDVLTDAYVYSGNAKYPEMARRPLAGIRDFYVIKTESGWATPGDGLARVSCDVATGTAGVVRAIDRYLRKGDADFCLDSFDSEFGLHDSKPESLVRRASASPGPVSAAGVRASS